MHSNKTWHDIWLSGMIFHIMALIGLSNKYKMAIIFYKKFFKISFKDRKRLKEGKIPDESEYSLVL